jgi:homotetrameric cytidine deaminase
MTPPVATLSAADRGLVDAARTAAGNSYSPFSHFPVGAALRLASEEIVTGTNVETASYGGTVCAERSALVAARSLKGQDLEIDSLAVVGTAPHLRSCPPCAICRNMIDELMSPDARVLFLFESVWTARSVKELVPFPFALDRTPARWWSRMFPRRH